MTPLETAFCVAFVLVCAIWLGILLLFMWTRPAPWSCLRDRRERLPHPNCRARVVQPHKYSRWFV
jgi:hypothetical protein